MKMFFKNTAVAVAMLLLATACGDANIKNGVGGSVSAAKPLTAAEIQKLLIGHTFPYTKGGIYASSATDAIILWKGQTEETKWYATNEGNICYTVELFGGNEECSSLARTADGNYISEYNGRKRQIQASEIKKGKIF